MSRADRAARSHALRTASGSQLLVLGIVLAVFALWVVPGLSKISHGAGTDGGGRQEAGEIGEAVSAPPSPDVTAEAYRTVRAGECLAAPGEALPVAVDCAGEEAFLRIRAVTDDAGRCPNGPGLSDWYHSDGRGNTVALCLQREFRAGQCFAAILSTEHGGYAMTNADLRSRVECTAAEVPDPYNVVLVISEVLPVLPDGGECSQEPERLSSYWFWIANGDSVKVCATFAARGEQL